MRYNPKAKLDESQIIFERPRASGHTIYSRFEDMESGPPSARLKKMLKENQSPDFTRSEKVQAMQRRLQRTLPRTRR